MAGPIIHVHSFFEAMFRDGTNETFHITDVKSATFKAMMNYIYSENINIDSYDTARDLYYCAIKFMLLQLAQVCVTFMACNVSPWNACHALQMGWLCGEQALIDEAQQVIKSNIRNVLHHKSFYEVDISTIANIFSIEDLQVENELELFLALKKYALVRTSSSPKERKRKVSPCCEVVNKRVKLSNDSSENIDTEEQKVQITEQQTESKEFFVASLQPAMSAIRFLTLSSEHFVQHVARSGLLSARDALALLANTVSEDARLPLPDGFSDRRQPRIQATSTGTRGFKLAARRWAVRLLPRHECCIGEPRTTHYIGVFVSERCLEPAPAPWGCRLLVEFRLLAASPVDLPRTTRMEQTFTRDNPEWGFARFICLSELTAESKFVSNNSIVIDVRMKVLENISD